MAVLKNSKKRDPPDKPWRFLIGAAIFCVTITLLYGLGLFNDQEVIVKIWGVFITQAPLLPIILLIVLGWVKLVFKYYGQWR